ncbi:hypothetical protein SAMN05421823_103155 [Catalinimonas alkaloidigena]|uniref:Tetratricopeptide repeat-containing protein n=1 Tax=Catalinimonas alkaloidigena TaxID=1075417 RepID=A0A1G9DJV5_9BACT|nr:hypothetical protein [Catalinimonas alkaloidigena]SDK64167.1 hypothetical protein SAMN05421823_103155 [Catalinimonas alkaloidigena]
MRFFIWGLLFWTGGLCAQDLFDLSHTTRYAHYLLQDRRYRAAQVEFQRALQLAPGDSLLVQGLMRSYRWDDQAWHALQAARAYYPDSMNVPGIIAEERLQSLLDVRMYPTLYTTASSVAHFPSERRQHWQVGALLMQHRWTEAQEALTQASPTVMTQWAPLAEQGMAIRYKKPGLATGMSMVVPGTGRMYAGQWADGLLSMLNVGIFSWQAYRGFRDRGARSVYGWISSLFGVSFYVGNVYGSHRAAVLYNEKQNQRVTNEVERLLGDRH